MKAPMKSPRPKARPESKMAPKSSMRPRTRSDKEFEDEADAAADRAMKHSQPPTLVNKAAGGKVKKMAMGGKIKMVEKGGKKVPAFAADGVGKMAMGGKVSEYGGKENYKSKASMMKHEGMESKAVEKMESKMAGGGMCRGMGAAKKGGSYSKDG